MSRINWREINARKWDKYCGDRIYDPINKRGEYKDTSTYAGVRGLSRDIRVGRSLNVSSLKVR